MSLLFKKSNSVKNNFIIFGHHFNELDMNLPFIDYVLTTYKDNVTLYTSIKDIPGGYYHLEYLRTRHHLEEKLFLDEQCFSKYKTVINIYGKIKQLQYKRKGKNQIRYIGYLITLIIMIIKRVLEYVLRKPVKSYVDTLNISDIIMVYFSGETGFPANAIVEYAEKRGIKTVGYFQGFLAYSNLQYTVKSIDKEPIRVRIARYIREGKRQYCTSYLVGKSVSNTKHFRSSGNVGFKKADRVFETVVPRYTSGWTEKFRAYLMKNEQFNYGDEKKTNVVFFLAQVKQNVNYKEFANILHLLSKLDNINFVYKPHTRNPFNIDKDAISSSLGFNKIVINGYDGSHINSMLLSGWADVGIVYGSSIAMQLLIDNVPIIVPTFVHTNSSILEKHKICITANSLDELTNILTNNTKDDIRKLIDNARVEKFLNEYLDANKDYEQIMQEYYEAVVDQKLAK
jgi:predicted ThiF/HesA family dinucleotide-utilizing enzyme